MKYYLIIWIISVLAPFFHLLLIKKQRNPGEIIGLFLLYQLIFTVGFGGLLGYYAHIFEAEETANYIGWLPGSPFQAEVGYANLTFGILGLLCLFFRGNFWVATVFGISIWYLANAYGHIQQIVVNQNYSPGNAGAPLYIDIFLPVLLLSLLSTYSFLKKN